MGITIYGCEPDEAALFREMAPRLGVVPDHHRQRPFRSEYRSGIGQSMHQCRSQDNLGSPLLVALQPAGVRYISTRSVGYDHIDLECAQSLGITVENVAYSPDSVADYTLMLMLMVVRRAKSTLHRVQVRRLPTGRRAGAGSCGT